MITANLLREGRVVYWGGEGVWTSDMSKGAALPDDEAEAALALAQKDEATQIAGPYLIEVEETHPAGRERLKESIRLQGPTAGPSAGHGAMEA